MTDTPDSEAPLTKPVVPVGEVYDDANYLYWACERLFDQLEHKWAQIEGIHRRARYIITVLLGVAVFVAAAVRPFDPNEMWIFGVSLLAPLLIGIFGVLVPRIGSENDCENIWSEELRRYDPDAILDTLATSLLATSVSRDAELDSKGRWLVATSVFSILGIFAMVLLLALSGPAESGDKSNGKETEASTEAR